MPDWIHRIKMTLLHSVAEADLPEPESNYILDPDLSAVAGQPTKYWEVSGDAVTLMDAAARAVVDAAELEVQKDSVVAELDQNMALIRAVFLVILDEFNLLRAEHGLAPRTVTQLRNAAKAKLG